MEAKVPTHDVNNTSGAIWQRLPQNAALNLAMEIVMAKERLS